jgi:hypothetical protein
LAGEAGARHDVIVAIEALARDEDQRSRIAAAYLACDSALAVELGG